MNDEDFYLELKQTFVAELFDVLGLVETAFLRFEKEPTDQSIVNEVFRYFHNIKGSSKTVGFNDLSGFAHKAENILAKIRDGSMHPNQEIVDALLEASDLMRTYAENLSEGAEDPAPLLEHTRLLEALLEGNGEKIASSADVTPDASLQEAEALLDGQSAGLFDDDDAAKTVTPVAPVETTASSSEAPAKKEESTPTPEVKSAETLKTPPRATQIQIEESIKVPLSKINQILDLFGEQVILQSALDHATATETRDQDFIEKSVSQMKKLTLDLQHIIVTLRMIPLENLFNRMERSVRDVAKLTHKDVDFLKQGQSTELDKTIVDSLIDPLTHMVRNAVDHGIEDPDEREKNGKPRKGTIKLTAQRIGGSFEIIVSDDGKGLSKEKILAKAVQKGIVKSTDRLTDPQIFDLIFASGFSTVENATEVSGRGVGMDVVQQQIQKLKGTCTIQSEQGKGSKFIIKVPLSLAMFNGTVVSVNEQRYVFPNADFSEAIAIDEKDIIAASQHDNVIRLGERILKVFDLRKSLKSNVKSITKAETPQKCLAIVSKFEGENIALLVDEILSQDQIVLKELGPEAKQIKGASGSTILGDGRVALVLDIQTLLKKHVLSYKKSA